MLTAKKLIEGLKNLIWLSLTVLLSGIILTVSLIVIYCIPINGGNLAKSVQVLESEGDRPNVLERNIGDWSYADSFEPGIVSTTNELANIYRAGGMDDKSPVYNAIVMDSVTWGPYPRYWHFYAGILRLLLLVFDIKEIRFISFIFQFLFVLAIIWLISEKKGRIASLLFLTIYILMMPIAASTNSVYSFGLDGVLAGTYFLLAKARKTGEKILEKRFMSVFFCVMGIMICALDQLITCIIAWALPILLILYLYGENRKLLQNLLTVINTGISWIIGYAGSWLFKILIAGIYMKNDVLGEAMGRTTSWVEGTEAFSPGRLYSLYTVYKHYTYKVYALMILLWIIYLSVKICCSRIKADSRIPALFLVSLGPIVWNLTLYEHVFYHHIMTYRQLSVSIVGLLYILYIAAGENKVVFKKEGLIRRLMILMMVFFCGFMLTLCIKESQDVYNADIPGEYISFDDRTGSVMMDINPSYKHISEISLGIQTVSDKGYYEFGLLEDGISVDTISVQASRYFDNSWQAISVDWDLKNGRDYDLRITAVDTDPGSELLVLNNSILSPMDLSGLMIGDEYVPYNPVFWIKYLRLPFKKDFVFYSMTFYLVIVSLCLVSYSVIIGKDKRHSGVV